MGSLPIYQAHLIRRGLLLVSLACCLLGCGAGSDTDTPDRVLSGLRVVPGSVWNVVLTATPIEVRKTASEQSEAIGQLEATETGVVATGNTATAGADLWIEVETATGAGWVRAFHLAPRVSNADFDLDDRPERLLEDFKRILEARGDLSPVLSRRGLHVVHFAPMQRFSAEEIAGLLIDPTLREWGGAGCDPGDCPPATVAQALADAFIDVFDDPDRMVSTDAPVGGGNATPPTLVVPEEFRNFHYHAVFDRGDDEEMAGLDWATWFVYFDYEDDRPVIVAVQPDYWSP